jgi:hypothetical protein
MGDPITLALLGVQALMSISSAQQQQEAAVDQFKAEDKELTRQQTEANLQAQEQKSERAREADKQFASMVTSMEALGGAGSMDEARFGVEIGANSGLDISRIEGNRRREVEALQSSKQASRQRALGTVEQAQGQQVGALISLGGGINTAAAQQAERERQQTEAKNFTT